MYILCGKLYSFENVDRQNFIVREDIVALWNLYEREVDVSFCECGNILFKRMMPVQYNTFQKMDSTDYKLKAGEMIWVKCEQLDPNLSCFILPGLFDMEFMLNVELKCEYLKYGTGDWAVMLMSDFPGVDRNEITKLTYIICNENYPVETFMKNMRKVMWNLIRNSHEQVDM